MPSVLSGVSGVRTWPRSSWTSGPKIQEVLAMEKRRRCRSRGGGSLQVAEASRQGAAFLGLPPRQLHHREAVAEGAKAGCEGPGGRYNGAGGEAQKEGNLPYNNAPRAAPASQHFGSSPAERGARAPEGKSARREGAQVCSCQGRECRIRRPPSLDFSPERVCASRASPTRRGPMRRTGRDDVTRMA